jgi:transcriptional regulator with XRE-family HTH domain
VADPFFWGKLIKELRLKQGITQRRLARLVEVNRTALRNIEAGSVAGDIVIIEKLLSYLGYELEVLACEGVEERLRRQARDESDPDRRSNLAAKRLLIMQIPLHQV